MANNIQRDLKRIHTKVMRRYLKESEANRDAQIARDLERDFNDMLLYLLSNQNTQNISPSQWEIIQDLQMAGIPHGLFDFINQSDISATQMGFVFEQRLEQLLSELLNTNTPINIGSEIAYTQQLTLEMAKQLRLNVEIWDEKLNQFVRVQAQEINDNPKRLVNYIGATGKVDLSVPQSSIQLRYTYSPRMMSFLQELQGRNISAKCYTDMKHVKIGSSGLFRTIYSVLSDINESEETIKNIYYGLRNSSNNIDKTKHKSHIIFAYELMGMGQLRNMSGSITKFGEVDFLIVFDKAARKIVVRSTKDLARKYFKQHGEKMAAARSINLTI